jgi:hypothetical protein
MHVSMFLYHAPNNVATVLDHVAVFLDTVFCPRWHSACILIRILVVTSYTCQDHFHACEHVLYGVPNNVETAPDHAAVFPDTVHWHQRPANGT